MLGPSIKYTDYAATQRPESPRVLWLTERRPLLPQRQVSDTLLDCFMVFKEGPAQPPPPLRRDPPRHSAAQAH